MSAPPVRERWASPEEQARLYLAMGQKMGHGFEETRKGMVQALDEQRNDPEWRENYNQQCAEGRRSAMRRGAKLMPWVPVSDGDACSPLAAAGLTACQRHDLVELHRLALNLSLRPTPRELAEACDGTRHSPARLKGYVEDVLRDRAARRARRAPC